MILSETQKVRSSEPPLIGCNFDDELLELHKIFYKYKA